MEYGECRCSSEQVIIVVVCCVESFRIASGRVLGRERMGGRACLLFPLQQQSSQSRDYVNKTPPLASATLRRMRSTPSSPTPTPNCSFTFTTRDMAIEKGVTEIADSEDDLMTSSPRVVPDEAADKLCAMARVPYQERQDALHGADCLHQAFAQRNANAASCSAEGSGGDRDDAQIDDASKIDQTNMTLQDPSTVQEEGAINELGHHDLGSHSELHSSSPASITGAISDESNVMLVQALPRMESQPGEEVPARKADTGIQQDRSNQTTKDEPAKQSDMRAVESAVVKDVENYSGADYQEQPCIASSNSPARNEQAATESIHPIILGTQSKAPSTIEQHPSDASVDVEASDGFRPLSQGYTTHGSLFQESSNNGSQAAGHSSAHGYPNENAVCPRPMLIHFTRSHS